MERSRQWSGRSAPRCYTFISQRPLPPVQNPNQALSVRFSIGKYPYEPRVAKNHRLWTLLRNDASPPCIFDYLAIVAAHLWPFDTTFFKLKRVRLDQQVNFTL